MDAAGLQRELERCHRHAYTWALHCCRWRPENAEDVLQTAYLKVLDGRARFDGRSSFQTWLFAVIRRTAVDDQRWSFRRRHWAEPLTEDVAEAVGESGIGEGDAALAEALQRLSDRQREVLLLVFYHELSVEDAAAVMGIGVGSARTHSARGKERLKQMLQRREDLDDA